MHKKYIAYSLARFISVALGAYEYDRKNHFGTRLMLVLDGDYEVNLGLLPDIRQCRIIWPDFRYLASKSQIIQKVEAGLPAYPAKHPG